MTQKGLGWLERLLFSSAFWYLLPTPAIYFLNRKRVKAPPQIGSMPTSDLSQRERRRLLEASEARLANIEGKGPGIAAVTAVLAAGVLIALTDGWGETGWPAKGLLVLAAVYTALSLLTAIYLVGPLKRHVVDVPDLEEAITDADPEERLAAVSAEAAMRNDLQNMRLANHLDAARRELAYAYGLILAGRPLRLREPLSMTPTQGPRDKGRTLRDPPPDIPIRGSHQAMPRLKMANRATPEAGTSTGAESAAHQLQARRTKLAVVLLGDFASPPAGTNSGTNLRESAPNSGQLK